MRIGQLHHVLGVVLWMPVLAAADLDAAGGIGHLLSNARIESLEPDDHDEGDPYKRRAEPEMLGKAARDAPDDAVVA